jgi:hypothetical protein
MKLLPFCPSPVLAALALLVPPAAAAESGGTFNPHLGQTVEITRSHSWCWFPTIHRFRSGEILVGVVMSPDQVNSEGAFSAYCLSRDGGQTWSRRYTLGVGANQDGAWSEVPDENDQICQWGSYPEPARAGDDTHFTAIMTRYSHGGRRVAMDLDVGFRTAEPAALWPTWLFAYSFDHKLPIADTHILQQFGGRPWGNIIRGAHGELLCLCYYTSQADERRAQEEAKTTASRHRYHLHNVLLRSDDGGRSWSEYGKIAAVPAGGRPSWMGDEGCGEGSLALLPDGRLYAVYRTGGKGGIIGNAWSSDGGKTWSPPAPIGFSGVAPRIHRLSNGMLVLVTGRPGPVVMHFNPDGRGEKWTRELTIYSDKSTHYTDVLEVEPGKLLVVYDHVPYGWYEIPFADRDARNIIYGTFVDLGGEKAQ